MACSVPYDETLCSLSLYLLTPLTRSVLRSPGEVTAYGTCGCGHSGPRDRSPTLVEAPAVRIRYNRENVLRVSGVHG